MGTLLEVVVAAGCSRLQTVGGNRPPKQKKRWKGGGEGKGEEQRMETMGLSLGESLAHPLEPLVSACRQAS